ncbi:lytic transglycosylase domain-containing protein [Clostridium saccharoperbutylacetonicum]|uniref:lytic transglycosylase domain-containing protein n=1 Tax=Clostridium saccharoperbutylacetonicum TaxID=36745 RepID=UPI000983E6A9|nr:lytic transglycosylase domain-containing protein [Clostridium saccharoperbutylacetonicum]AQR93615.1 soluble lytic murein transglycosylase precursor [Clostridium saccharoperbutylacetonicum]NSB29314.1 soluble lytic murein transglycosylase [Clostridium saccharoperbutylacetonicum]
MSFGRKILRKLIWFIVIFVAIIVGCRYLIKENFFPYKYKEYVDKYSSQYELDPLFVLAVIKTESNFDDDARSHKNAVGLMQITVETGEWAAKEMGYSKFSKEDLYNEEYNIKMGCWYLKKLNDSFDKNLDLTIAAYNAGPTNVKAWLENEKYSSNGKCIDYIPFGETKKYVDKVNTYYNIYKYLYKENASFFDINKAANLIKSLISVHFLS